jgi:hypothetical protein
MNPDLHPHWHDPVSQEPAHSSALPSVVGVTVSRRPAALLGIGLALLGGSTLFYLSGEPSVPGQLTETEIPAEVTEPTVPEPSEVPAPPMNEISEPEPVAQPVPLPTNPHSSAVQTPTGYEYPPVSQPFPPQPWPVAETYQPLAAEMGKGKPERQPQTGLPVWLLAGAGITAISLVRRRSKGEVLLYQ